MQNKYFKFLLMLLIVAIVIPQITLAFWYNPFSWHIWGNIWNYIFHKQTPAVEQQPQQNNVNLLDQIKNYAYDVSSEGLYFSKGMFGPQDSNYNPHAVQLTNGFYKSGPYHNTYVSGCTSDITHLISLATDSNGNPLYALGDLNGDGKEDAAVILNLEYKEENQAGPNDYCKPIGGQPEDFSRLMLIVLVNNNGKLEQKDSYMWGEANIPTASGLSDITINNGIITLNGKNTDEYKLINGKIVITGKSFQTPSLPQDLKTYNVNNFGFSFQYPGNLNFTIQDVQPPALFGMQTGSANTEGNVITVSVSAENLFSCVSPGQGGLATELIINGIPFYRTTGGGGGMGTFDTEIQYAAFENGRCYRVGLQYFTHNCDNYLPLESGNTRQEQGYNDCLANNKSAEALSGIPDVIVSTFKFDPNMAQVPAPTCSIQTDRQSYRLGDVIDLTWQSQNATGAFWNQPIEIGGARKNIVPPEGNPPTNGSDSTVANIEGNQTIDLKVSGLGGIADCSANIDVAHSDATPSITIDSGTISLTSNGAGNSNVVLKGTATNGALYNDDINLVLFNANYSGPFDEATIYSNGLRPEWLSGGAAIGSRQDNVPFENWSVKTYAPAGTTSVRVLAYPFYSSSTTSPTQPLANTIITLTPAQ